MEDEDGSWWCQHVETYFGTDDEDPGSALGEVERVPLFAAAARGNLRALQLLVDAGADVNFWHAGMNAALVAVHFGQVDVLRWLEEHGVDMAAELPEPGALRRLFGTWWEGECVDGRLCPSGNYFCRVPSAAWGAAVLRRGSCLEQVRHVRTPLHVGAT